MKRNQYLFSWWKFCRVNGFGIFKSDSLLFSSQMGQYFLISKIEIIQLDSFISMLCSVVFASRVKQCTFLSFVFRNNSISCNMKKWMPIIEQNIRKKLKTTEVQIIYLLVISITKCWYHKLILNSRLFVNFIFWTACFC